MTDAKPAVLVIDNYDSFTYNLVQYLGELGAASEVVRNDALTTDDIAAMRPARIIISPGPGGPDEAGVSLDTIRRFSGDAPILGVCLGHQTIAQAFGGRIVRAGRVMHGKNSMIHHAGAGLFKGLAEPFQATRYHSLVVEQASLPDCLEVTAWTEDDAGARDEIMALRHKTHPTAGVQFHPEAVLTEGGHEMLRRFLLDDF